MSFSKRVLAGTLTAVMVLGSMTGCGGVKKSDLSDDYSQVTVATYGDEEIKLDEVNYLLRNRQLMYEYYGAMYGMDIWSTEGMVDSLYEETMKSVLQTRVLCQHAADYNVELTDDEKAKVEEAVANIVDAEGSDAYYEIAGRDSDMLTAMLTKNAIANKVYYTIKEACEIKTTKDDCIQNAVTYLLLDEAEEEEETEAVTEAETESESETETEIETETEAEAETEAEEEAVTYTEDDANAILARVEKGEALSDIAQEMGLTATDANYGVKDEEQTSELAIAAASMTEGQSKVLHVDGTGWYVLYCSSSNDEEATESAYESAVDEEKDNYFSEVYEGLSKNKFKVYDQVLEYLNVTDTPVYNIETETETEEAAAEAETELESETETAAQ